jgi:hypothetical protein
MIKFEKEKKDELKQPKLEEGKDYITNDEAKQLLASDLLKILNLSGLIEVVSAAPTNKPTNFFGQLKIYNSKIYIYDYKNDAWVIADQNGTGITATKTFYAAASEGGTVNVLNTVSISNGLITSWTQTTPP